MRRTHPFTTRVAFILRDNQRDFTAVQLVCVRTCEKLFVCLRTSWKVAYLKFCWWFLRVILKHSTLYFFDVLRDSSVRSSTHTQSYCLIHCIHGCKKEGE